MAYTAFKLLTIGALLASAPAFAADNMAPANANNQQTKQTKAMPQRTAAATRADTRQDRVADDLNRQEVARQAAGGAATPMTTQPYAVGQSTTGTDPYAARPNKPATEPKSMSSTQPPRGSGTGGYLGSNPAASQPTSSGSAGMPSNTGSGQGGYTGKTPAAPQPTR